MTKILSSMKFGALIFIVGSAILISTTDMNGFQAALLATTCSGCAIMGYNLERDDAK